MARSARRDPALHAHRARGALAAGRDVLRHALHRPLPERLVVRGHPRPAHREGLASLERDRPRRRARAARAARRPPLAGAQRARDRPLRRATTAAGCAAPRAASERPAGAAAGPLQRRPEAQRRPDRRADARHVRDRRPALVRRARHDLPLRGHRDRARLGHADPDVPGRGPPLPGGPPPRHPPRPARHDARRRGRGLGAPHHAKWVEPEPAAADRE